MPEHEDELLTNGLLGLGERLAKYHGKFGEVVFLSGGQTPEQSIANLSAIMKLAKKKGAPWPIPFSFARTFQEEALDMWGGKNESMDKAREASDALV